MSKVANAEIAMRTVLLEYWKLHARMDDVLACCAALAKDSLAYDPAVRVTGPFRMGVVCPRARAHILGGALADLGDQARALAEQLHHFKDPQFLTVLPQVVECAAVRADIDAMAGKPVGGLAQPHVDEHVIAHGGPAQPFHGEGDGGVLDAEGREVGVVGVGENEIDGSPQLAGTLNGADRDCEGHGCGEFVHGSSSSVRCGGGGAPAGDCDSHLTGEEPPRGASSEEDRA